ncbi:unnamed protein product [Merluccius merluccius]
MTDTTFSIAAISGSFSNGVLGDPTAIIQTNVVDISNTTSDTSNRIIASTTIAPTTIASSGRPTNQALSQALLIILGTMGLALL